MGGLPTYIKNLWWPSLIFRHPLHTRCLKLGQLVYSALEISQKPQHRVALTNSEHASGAWIIPAMRGGWEGTRRGPLAVINRRDGRSVMVMILYLLFGVDLVESSRRHDGRWEL